VERIRAENCAEAFWTLDPYAVIQPNDPWHCDIDSFFDKNHYGFIKKLRNWLEPKPARPRYSYVGIVGHRGTGKTTQVREAIAEVQPFGVQPVYINAVEALDQTGFTFSDVILVMVRAVVDALSEAGLNIPKAQFELVKLWFAEELLTEKHSREIVGSLETEAGAEVSIPFLAKLMAKVTGTLKSSNEYSTEIRTKAGRDPGDLIRRANLLLDTATEAFSKKRGRDCTITVVFDNLEKLPKRKPVDEGVLQRADELKQLRCNLVLFFAPPDQYAPITIQASEVFQKIDVPMLPIRSEHEGLGVVDPKVFSAVRALLDKRVDLNKVFAETDACIWDIARYSGGRLRDIFHLARLACELAMPDPITPRNIEQAAHKLKTDRTGLAKPEHWPRLAEIHRDKQVANTQTDAPLLLHSLVLNYNDKSWWDIHPLIELDKRFSAEWAKLNPPP
jgi:hypothetical protein